MSSFKKKLLFILSVSVLLFSVNTAANYCSKFNCGKIENPLACSQKTDQLTFTLQDTCDSKTEFCPYLYGLKDEEKLCQKKSTTVKHYPGAPCKVVKDCIGSDAKCENSICVNKGLEEECVKNSDCVIGSFCSATDGELKVCKMQLTSNQCSSDYDCPNTHGCTPVEGQFYKGSCIRYFSVASGERVAKNENLSFCQSSFAATYSVDPKKPTEINTRCVDAKLRIGEGKKVQECTQDEDCVYDYSYKIGEVEINEFVTIAGHCECGYGKESIKYCKPGNLNLGENYTNYVDKQISLLNDPSCHTDERFSCSHIFETKLYKYSDFKNTEADVMKSHLLTSADACVKNVVFPYYDKNLSMPKCPKFNCSTKPVKDVIMCAHSNGYDQKDKYTVKVTACEENRTCAYNPENFFISSGYMSMCVEKDAPITKDYAYPGEACTKGENCKEVIIAGVPTRTCVMEGGGLKCKGNAIKEVCLTDKDCNVGSYCAKVEGAESLTCAALKGLDYKCTKTTECDNKFICFSEKCTTPFSLVLGTSLTGKVENKFRDYLCASAFIFEGTCAEKRYDQVKNVSKNGLVSCGFGDSCYYNIIVSADGNSSLPHAEDCVCTYTENTDNTNGYCPYSLSENDAQKNRKSKILNEKLSTFNNPNQHTLNRLNFPVSDSQKCLSVYENVAYEGSSDCIFQVLGQGKCEKIEPDPVVPPKPSGINYITFNLSVILVILAALF
jgi:hypothetical protein